MADLSQAGAQQGPEEVCSPWCEPSSVSSQMLPPPPSVVLAVPAHSADLTSSMPASPLAMPRPGSKQSGTMEVCPGEAGKDLLS